MTHSELVVVRTFNDRIEAELAQSALQAAEIDSMVRSDDAGGLRPHMALQNGVELLVRSEDARAARQILDTDLSA
jgi:putative signal transducing protein